MSGAIGSSGDRAIGAVGPSEMFFPNATIPLLHIRLDESALTQLQLHPRWYVTGSVIEGRRIYHDVGIHLKGNFGTFQTAENKPSLTLSFDKFVKGQKFHGLEKLHLNNSAQDPSYLSECLCRELFASAGVPVARATHARVEINGRDVGLYVLVEGYDKAFLRHHFKQRNGNLYDSEFRHDIIDPLKRHSGTGPNDHADLKALAAACAESGPDIRLAKIGSILDLDRFYSFLALELMIGHFDGYAQAVNNYWVYHDPGSGKLVFLPHGMDQICPQPQTSLFPELKGILAQAVLETAEGRRKFREYCTLLFTNHFSGLSNRVEQLRQRIRPELAKLGANAVAQHDRAAAALQQRIIQRMEDLRKQLLVPPPSLTILSPAREVVLTNWLGNVDKGWAKLSEKAAQNGTKILQALVEARGATDETTTGADTHAREEGAAEVTAEAVWETRVLLPAGQYRILARIAADQPVFRGPDLPIVVKLWGGRDLQFESTREDAQHLAVAHTFELTSEAPEEVLVQFKLQSSGDPIVFDVGPVRLLRVE